MILCPRYWVSLKAKVGHFMRSRKGMLTIMLYAHRGIERCSLSVVSGFCQFPVLPGNILDMVNFVKLTCTFQFAAKILRSLLEGKIFWKDHWIYRAWIVNEAYGCKKNSEARDKPIRGVQSCAIF